MQFVLWSFIIRPLNSLVFNDPCLLINSVFLNYKVILCCQTDITHVLCMRPRGHVLCIISEGMSAISASARRQCTRCMPLGQFPVTQSLCTVTYIEHRDRCIYHLDKSTVEFVVHSRLERNPEIKACTHAATSSYH